MPLIASASTFINRKPGEEEVTIRIRLDINANKVFIYTGTNTKITRDIMDYFISGQSLIAFCKGVVCEHLSSGSDEDTAIVKRG